MTSVLTKEQIEFYRDFLISLNNEPRLIDQDHLTITAFFKTHHEYNRHLYYLAEKVDRLEEYLDYFFDKIRPTMTWGNE